MAELTTHDEAIPTGAARGNTGGRLVRNVENESVTLGSSVAVRDGSARGEDDVITLGSRTGHKFGDNVKRMLANIDKHGTVDDEAPAAATDEPAETPEPEAPAEPEKPAETPPAEAPAPPAAGQSDEITAANERLATRNRELLAENERLKGGAARREPNGREKALLEAWQMYPEDPAGALRRFLAAVHDVDDVKHESVDKEVAAIYQDLTAKELGVSLDESKKAQIDGARTRLLLARDKRERKAELEAASQPKDDPEATQTAQMHQVIGGRISAKPIADRFPLLTSLAEDFDGAKPEAALWTEIKRGVRSGEYDPKTPDDKLIELAAHNIEARYQARADRIVAARKPASTAQQPTPAAPEKANNETGNGHGARTITTRDASVAPATPPATKQEPANSDKPKYKNEKERRAALARKYAGET